MDELTSIMAVFLAASSDHSNTLIIVASSVAREHGEVGGTGETGEAVTTPGPGDTTGRTATRGVTTATTPCSGNAESTCGALEGLSNSEICPAAVVCWTGGGGYLSPSENSTTSTAF